VILTYIFKIIIPSLLPYEKEIKGFFIIILKKKMKRKKDFQGLRQSPTQFSVFTTTRNQMGKTVVFFGSKIVFGTMVMAQRTVGWK
jgi:hypothetical protein